MPEQKSRSLAKLIGAFAIVYVVWGSTYIFIRFAIETIPPFLMIASRYTLAGVLMYAYARARGAARPSWANWKAGLVTGLLLFTVGNGAVVFGEQRIASGLVALIVALVPLWLVLLPWLWKNGPRPRGLVFVGLLLGVIGLLLLVGPGEFAGGSGVSMAGAIVLVIGTLGWAAGSIYAKDAALPEDASMAAALEMLGGGVPTLFLSAAFGELGSFRLADASTLSVLSVLYLVVFGSLIAFTAYMWLLRNTTPAKLSTYAYVNPIVALFLGWALAGEQLTFRMGIASAVILAGVVLLTVAPSGAAASEPRERGHKQVQRTRVRARLQVRSFGRRLKRS